MANGAPTVSNGLVISGVTTVTTLDLNGDLDVDGHLNVDNVSVSGISTFTGIVDVAGSNSTVRLGNGASRRLMYRAGDNDIVLEAASNFFYRQKISDTSHRWYTNGADEKLMISGAGKVGINSTNPNALLEIYTAPSADWKFRIDTTVSDGVGSVSYTHLRAHET